MLHRTHRVWTSDCIDALARVDIQRGFLQFSPPELMGANVGHHAGAQHWAHAGHGLSRGVGAAGNLGVALNVRHLDDREKQS